MEKVITPEERLKRAEEIYYRRKSQGVRVSTSTVNFRTSNNKISLGKKMLIQIIACVIMYTAFFIIKGYNNIFSENVIKQTESLLNYDINFHNVYNNIVDFFNNSVIKNFNINKNIDNNSTGNDNNVNSETNNIENGNSMNSETNSKENSNNVNSETNSTENSNNIENNTEDNMQNSNNTNENRNNENAENTNQQPQNATNETVGMGGGSDNSNNVSENKSQMELDAEYVKQNCSLIIPVKGHITSGFGNREPTEIISAFHQGVDIGAVTGTSIYAAMEGTVVASSFAGDYGNHIKIQNGNILTVYAHCSQLNVSVRRLYNSRARNWKSWCNWQSYRTTLTF